MKVIFALHVHIKNIKSILGLTCLLLILSGGHATFGRGYFFMGKVIDITGQRFGKWVVIGDAPGRGPTHPYVRCRCDCGTEKDINKGSLKRGHSNSCSGCRDYSHLQNRPVVHGHTTHYRTSQEYNSWKAMKRRCYRKNDKRYKHYGGRGIKVCDRWLNSFNNFLTDMGNKPTPKHSIERDDVNGNYEPSNCRWATNKEQSMNTTRTVFVTFMGQTKTMMQWSEEFRIKRATLYARYQRNGLKSFEQLYESVTNIKNI